MRETNRGRGGSPTRLERLKGALALVEALLQSGEDGTTAAAVLIHGLTEILVDLDQFPYVEFDGHRTPNFGARGISREEIVKSLGRKWTERCKDSQFLISSQLVLITKGTIDRLAADDDEPESEALQQQPRDFGALQVFARQLLTRIAEEELPRDLLRDGLRFVGMEGRAASDWVDELPSEMVADERQEHLVDFAAERLDFDPDRTVPFHQLYEAYVAYCSGTDAALDKEPFGRGMRLSLGVTGYLANIDGRRIRSLRGVGLRATTDEPVGAVAKRLRTEFLRLVRAPEWAAKLDEARAALRGKS